MAQNVTINGVDYTGVPGVEIPLTSGVGTALYLDAENYRTAAEQDVIDESKQPAITDLATIRSGASAGATALQPPASGLAVNKYFRVASVDPLTLDAVDAPDATMKIKLNGTAQTPGSDGYVNIPQGDSGNLGIYYESYAAGLTLSNRGGNRVITGTTLDYAVRRAMTDGIGSAWTDAEKTGAWSRCHSIKTTMDSVAVAGARYYLGEQTAVSITMPTDALLGQEISVVFYSGATAATLTINGTTIGDIPAPTANQRIELSMLWDGDYWAVLSNVMEVTA